MSFSGFWLNESEFQLFIWRMRISTTLSPTGQAEDQLAFVKLSSLNDKYHRKACKEIDTSLFKSKCESHAIKNVGQSKA